MTRKYTKMLLEMVDGNVLEKKTLIRDLLNWMPEAEVEKFAEANGYIEIEEE